MGFNAGDYAYFIIWDGSYRIKKLRISEAIRDGSRIIYKNAYGEFPPERVFGTFEKAQSKVVDLLLD